MHPIGAKPQFLPDPKEIRAALELRGSHAFRRVTDGSDNRSRGLHRDASLGGEFGVWGRGGVY